MDELEQKRLAILDFARSQHSSVDDAITYLISLMPQVAVENLSDIDSAYYVLQTLGFVHITPLSEALSKLSKDNFNKGLSNVMYNLHKYDLDYLIAYHGSYTENLIPKFGLGNTHCDYGKGFYTTLEIEKASEWAHLQELESGYIYEITINLSGLSIFNFEKYPTYVWIAELIKHRIDLIEVKNKQDLLLFIDKFGRDITDDIWFGWRADSSFYTILDLFINGDISYENLDTFLHLGNQGYQFFIKTEKAFQSITNISNKGHVSHKYFDNYYMNLGNAINTLYDVIDKAGSVAKSTSFISMIKE